MHSLQVYNIGQKKNLPKLYCHERRDSFQETKGKSVNTNISPIIAKRFLSSNHHIQVSNSSVVHICVCSDSEAQGEQYQPSFFGRLLAASIYVIPTLNANAITLSLFKWWASMSWAWFLIEPLTIFYYSSPLTALIIYFVVFLAIVRNKSFKHVVRFHALQSMLVEIVIALVQTIRMYLPPEIRWSVFVVVLDRFLGATILTTLSYCIWHAIQGRYADIPFVSDAVYVQIDLIESFGG